MLSPSKVTMYVDGSSRGNPGPAGIGIAIFADEDTTNPTEEISKYIGITTNNVAEYEAIIHALKWIIEKNAEHAIIKLDSELAYKQIIGIYRIKSHRIAIQLRRINTLKAQIKDVSFDQIPRTENKLANRLAQRASKKVQRKHLKYDQRKLLEQ
jgi:ribonuclease HI